MRVLLTINGKRVSFWLNVGWYRGEPFALFSVNVFEEFVKSSWTIFGVQVLKLMFCIGFDLID